MRQTQQINSHRNCCRPNVNSDHFTLHCECLYSEQGVALCSAASSFLMSEFPWLCSSYTTFHKKRVQNLGQQTHSPLHFPFLLRLSNLFYNKNEKSPGSLSLLGMSHFPKILVYCVYEGETQEISWKISSGGSLLVQTYSDIHSAAPYGICSCCSLWNTQLRQWLDLSECWTRWSDWSERKISWDRASRILHLIENSLLCAGVWGDTSHPCQDACRMIL